MAKVPKSEDKRRALSRDEIINVEEKPKTFKLPSGIYVKVNYLSYFMLIDILKNIETDIEENTSEIFTKKVISWLLRDNVKKELDLFSEEDKNRLIEIAVSEWGCDEEFKKLSEESNYEKRFLKAVKKQEEILAKQLNDSLAQIKINMSNPISILDNLQVGIASSLQSVLGQMSVVNSVPNALQNVNIHAINQLNEISEMATSIYRIAEGIASSQISVSKQFEKTMLENVSGTISSYKNLMRDILPIERFSALPDSMRYYPTLEMRNTSVVTGQLIRGGKFKPENKEIIIPETEDLLDWLESLDSSFPNMLLGAEKTIYSKNPDHCRHFASSHRELCTHILHSLAPDSFVKKWTDDINHFEKGRPTRRARMLFIARECKNESFKDFLIKDFENEMKLLNADEHDKIHEYSENELILLHKRFLSALGFLMQIMKDYY